MTRRRGLDPDEHVTGQLPLPGTTTEEDHMPKTPGRATWARIVADLDRLPRLDAAPAGRILDKIVPLPDGRRLPLGDLRPSDVAALRAAVVAAEPAGATR